MTTLTPYLGLPKPEGTDLISQGYDAIGDLADAIDALLGGPWDTYTPVWSGSAAPSIGNGSLAGAYRKIGRTVHFRVRLAIGSTTTLGSGAWQFTMPFTAAAEGQHPVGNARLIDSSASQQYGRHVFMNSTAVVAMVGDAVNSYVQPTVPFAWAVNDLLLIAGTYESAA